MLGFFHNFNPDPLMFSLAGIKVYWYGLFVGLGFLAAFFIALYLAKKRGLKTDDIIDLSLYLFFFGLIGARVYDIFLEWPYYLNHPWDIFKIWQGGLAIHGALLLGAITMLVYAKKKKDGLASWRERFFKLTAVIVPGLALGQAIGRWGNYFNQELFGRPTLSSWGIFINPINRPSGFSSWSHFHPTFLYESIGCFLIFVVLLIYSLWVIKKNRVGFYHDFLIVSVYVLAYSGLRFFLEFIRLDPAPIFLGLRWPQFMSLILIASVLFLAGKYYSRNYINKLNKKSYD